MALFPQIRTKNDQTLLEKIYVFDENDTSFEICFENVEMWSSLKEKLDGKICTVRNTTYKIVLLTQATLY